MFNFLSTWGLCHYYIFLLQIMLTSLVLRPECSRGTMCIARLLMTRGPSQYKYAVLQRYRDSHCKDKTVSQPSYLYNGIPIQGKTVFLLRRGDGDIFCLIWGWISKTCHVYNTMATDVLALRLTRSSAATVWIKFPLIFWSEFQKVW